MNRKLAIGLLLPALMWGAGAGVFSGQEAPEPPEPPDEPGAIIDLDSQRATVEGRTWLGVTLEDVTVDVVRDLKLPGEYGVIVKGVDEDSPAAKAGLQKGDVIIEFAGERVRSEAQLRRLVRETPPGRTVKLQLIREGQTRAYDVKLESRANQFYFPVPEIHIPAMNMPQFDFPFAGGRPSLGISGDDLTTQLASYFGVKQGKGVLVREVVVGSPAGKAGVKAGDVIVAVDGKSVAAVAELRHATGITAHGEKRKVNLTIVRDHHEQTVPIELERLEPGVRGRAAAGFGMDAGELQHM